MRIRQIQTKVILTILASFGLCGVMVLWLVHRSYVENARLLAAQSLHSANESFANLERNDIRMLSATLDGILDNQEIVEAFKQRDYDALLHLTAPVFQRLKHKHDITHWYFLTPEPESTCFLRVHNPSIRGDVIRRATFKKSVETKTFASGKELGKTAFALRVVHPVRDRSGTLIGYMELGQEIDSFVQQMKAQTGNEYGLLINKSYLEEQSWAAMRAAQKLPSNWNDLRSAVVAATTSGEASLIGYEGDLGQVPDRGLVLETTYRDRSVFLRGILPIYDAEHRKAGALFVIEDVTPLYRGLLATQRKVLFFLIVCMVSASAFVLVVLKRLVFRRLNAVIETATRVAGGAFEAVIVPQANDEVGRLEELLEQFRNLFVSTVRDYEPLAGAESLGSPRIHNER